MCSFNFCTNFNKISRRLDLDVTAFPFWGFYTQIENANKYEWIPTDRAGKSKDRNERQTNTLLVLVFSFDQIKIGKLQKPASFNIPVCSTKDNLKIVYVNYTGEQIYFITLYTYTENITEWINRHRMHFILQYLFKLSFKCLSRVKQTAVPTITTRGRSSSTITSSSIDAAQTDKHTFTKTEINMRISHFLTRRRQSEKLRHSAFINFNFYISFLCLSCFVGESSDCRDANKQSDISINYSTNILPSKMSQRLIFCTSDRKCIVIIMYRNQQMKLRH